MTYMSPETSSRGRLLLALGMVAYVAVFQWSYINYLYPFFEYFGYDYNQPQTSHLILGWVLSLLPCLWMPLTLTRPSQLAYWVLYLTVIVPSMFVPLYAGLDQPAEIVVLMLTLFAGFSITGMCYLLPLLSINPPRISRRLFWNGVGCFAVALAVWIVVAFREHLRIVSFLDVYDLRGFAEDLIAGSRVNYALMWLSGAINPFLMGWGLYHRRTKFFVAGALGQLLVFAGLGTKGSILSILFIAGFYLLSKRGGIPFALKLTWGCVALLGGLCISFLLAGKDPGPLHSMVLFVVFMRTFGMNGLMTAQYYHFFERNPLTYFSHINLVNMFVKYPYANPIGVEVGSYYTGDAGLDSTAHFWATDGLASLGLGGVLLISVFCGFVLWIIDSAAQRHDSRLSALVLCYAAFNLSNISIFTSLFSGGLGLLILLLYVMPHEDPEVCVAPAVLAAAG
jgi:hypothetical protein